MQEQSQNAPDPLEPEVIPSATIQRSWQSLSELGTKLEDKSVISPDKESVVLGIKEQLEILFGERWSENYQAKQKYELELKKYRQEMAARNNEIAIPHPAAIVFFILALVSFIGFMIGFLSFQSVASQQALANTLGLAMLWVPLVLAFIGSKFKSQSSKQGSAYPTLAVINEPTAKERFEMIKKIAKQIVAGPAQGVLETAIYDGVILQETITKDVLLNQKQTFVISSLLSDVIAAGVLIGEIEAYQKTRTELLKSDLVNETDKQKQKDLIIELMVSSTELEELISETATRLSFIRAEILKLKQAKLNNQVAPADRLIKELAERREMLSSKMADGKKLLEG